MGRGAKQTFFQRRHTHGQQVHEKVLNIANHQGSVIKTTMSYHVSPKGYDQKTRNNKCWQGWGEKGTFVHCWWECKLVPLWKTVWRFLKKLKIDIPYDPAIPLLVIYSKQNHYLKEISAFLCSLQHYLQQPRHQKKNLCPFMDVLIRKMCNGILLNHKKKEILSSATTWIDLEGIMLSEINQREKDKCHIISLICGI